MGRRRRRGGGGWSPPPPPSYPEQRNLINNTPAKMFDGPTLFGHRPNSSIHYLRCWVNGNLDKFLSFLNTAKNNGFPFHNKLVAKEISGSTQVMYLELTEVERWNANVIALVNKFNSGNLRIEFKEQILNTYNSDLIKKNSKLTFSQYSLSVSDTRKLLKHPRIRWTLFGFDWGKKQELSMRKLEGKNYDYSWEPIESGNGTLLYSFVADRPGKIDDFLALNMCACSPIVKEGNWQKVYLYYVINVGSGIRIYKRLYGRIH